MGKAVNVKSHSSSDAYGKPTILRQVGHST